VSGRVRLAVIGHPIAHSLSPVMHRAGLDALGRDDVTYEALDVPRAALGATLGRLGEEGYLGLNVTLPHKTAAMAHLASIDAAARAVGAVNTLVREGGAWIGTNTDVVGLARSLAESAVEVTAKAAVVLGTGGAARASVMALAGAREVIVVGRRLDVAEEVARLHPRGIARPFDRLGGALGSADLLVQATSATLGAEADTFAASLGLERLGSDATVVELVYRPRETAVLALARRLGLRTVDGVGMLVHQGAASLTRWIGAEPSAAAMRDAVERALQLPR
jgi:shikimate dehydrogenase